MAGSKSESDEVQTVAYCWLPEADAGEGPQLRS